MTISTYSNIGTVIFWFGVFTIISTIILFVMLIKGVSIGDFSDLHLHDSYYIVFHWRALLFLLMPIVAGILLVLTGRIIQSHNSSSDLFLAEMDKDSEEVAVDKKLD